MHKRALIRGVVVTLTILAVIVVSFLLMVMLKSPAGQMDVVFNIDVGLVPQVIQIDPSASRIFIGGPEGVFKIISREGAEEFSTELNHPVLDISVDHNEKIAVVRLINNLKAFGYNGELMWDIKIPDYLPEKTVLLPRGRVGVYFRNGRGEEPMVGVYDVSSGVAEVEMKLNIQRPNISPAFMPDGKSIVFEVVPGVISEVGLTEGLPVYWKAHIDTYDSRFNHLEFVITNSNLVVCYFRVDSRQGMIERFREVYAFDPDGTQAKGSDDAGDVTLELEPFWMKRIEGEIAILDVNENKDQILVQAKSLTILGRDGEALTTENASSGFYFSYLGDLRYMSSYYLEGSSGNIPQVLMSAREVGREGDLWRRSEAMKHNILPVVTPDCENMLMVLPETQRLLLLTMTH